MSKIIVPVDMRIARPYRMYVTVDEDASDDAIKEAAVKEVVEWQIDVLVDVEDLDIEEDDILTVRPCYEDSWSEEEDKDIKEILNKIKED